MKIFIDVDNTILEHYGFYSYETEGRIHSSLGRYPQYNKKAIEHMFNSSVCHDPEVIKNLFMHDDCYILTKYQHSTYEALKQKRVAEILGIKQEELLELKDTKGNPKYIAVPMEISKVTYVKEVFSIDSIEGFILIDDYSQNIIEWEKYNGLGIKYYNQYNSEDHPTNGISISNFKLFDFYISNSEIKDLIFVDRNKYKLKLIIDKLVDGNKNIECIDVLTEVYKDIKGKLSIKDFQENNKYSHMNFVIEYYKFMLHTDAGYWSNYFSRVMEKNKFTVLTSTFEPNISSMYSENNFEKNSSLSFGLVSSKSNFSEVYDVYITMSEERFIGDVSQEFDDIILFLRTILK